MCCSRVPTGIPRVHIELVIIDGRLELLRTELPAPSNQRLPTKTVGTRHAPHSARSNHSTSNDTPPLFRRIDEAFGMGGAMNSAPYVPRTGERVQIERVCPEDPNPAVEAGDVITVAFATGGVENAPFAEKLEKSGFARGWERLGIDATQWVLVRSANHKPGVSTWCRVIPLPPPDWQPPDDERETLAPTATELEDTARAEATFAEVEASSWAERATAFTRANALSYDDFELRRLGYSRED